MRSFLFLFLFFFVAGSVVAEEGWLDAYGNLIVNTDAQKWVAGFGGWLIVTSDQNWKEKWNNPKGGNPVFTEARDVELGEKITILTLYKNPQIDLNNRIDITCDIKITKPDGTISYEEDDIACSREELIGRRDNVRLTHAIIDYIGEIGDPYGFWVVEVTLKDNNAQIVIPLKRRFELINTATMTQYTNNPSFNTIAWRW